MKLSIGLIVKNEEKHLENCLKALLPLKEQMECEIIVADTGSTDDSRAIAERYADIVFDFEWIKDFAAARNATLDRASGEWYMFIDADEYMDNHQELIDFFVSGEYKKYNSATYVIRNYTFTSQNKFSDFSGSRMVKRNKSTRFIGSIHEHLILPPPMKQLSTFVHHYGYDNDDPILLKAKAERNLPLMEEELKKNPNDIRMMGLICDAMLAQGKVEEALESYYKQIEMHKKQKTEYAVRVKSYEGLIKLLINNKNEYQKGIDLALGFMNEKNKTFTMDIDFYYYIAQAYFNLDKKAEATEYFEKYIELLDQYEAGELITPDTRFCTIGCGNNRNIAYKYSSLAYFETDNAETALKTAEKIPDVCPDVSYADKEELVFKARLKLGLYEDIAALYSDYLDNNRLIDAMRYINKVEDNLLGNGVNKDQLLTAFADLEQESNYVILCRLRLSDSAEEAKSYINHFLAQKDIANTYGDLLYYILLYNLELDGLISILDIAQLSDFLNNAGRFHFNFGAVAYTYFKDRRIPTDFKELIVTASIQEYSLLANSANNYNLTDDEYISLLSLYVTTEHALVSQLYTPLALQEENLFVLPSTHRFAYYMYQADQLKTQGVEYIKHLKLALKSYESMRKGVELLLDRYTKQLESLPPSPERQLAEYAQVIKTQIKQLIGAGQTDAAASLIAQYRDIIPTDPEIDELSLMLGKPQGYIS